MGGNSIQANTNPYCSLDGISACQNLMAGLGSDMANSQTSGFMTTFKTCVTSIGGSSVEAVEMPSNDAPRGSVETGESLDIALPNGGYIVVDTSSSSLSMTKDLGYKTGAHLYLDDDGYLRDETGHFVLGGDVGENGAIPTFSALNRLERIQIPTHKLSSPRATTEITLSATLPADATEGNSYFYPVTVYDSLGTGHQIEFQFEKLWEEGLWHMTISPEHGERMTQNTAAGNPWQGALNGVVVRFNHEAAYAGFVAPSDGNYTAARDAFRTAKHQSEGAFPLLQEAKRLAARQPALAIAEIVENLETFRDIRYPNTPANTQFIAGADAIIDLFDGNTGDGSVGAALTAADPAYQNLVTAEQDARQTLNDLFDPREALPRIHVNTWRGSDGNDLSAAPSSISFSLHNVTSEGTIFHNQRAEQNGKSAAEYKGITIVDGFVCIEYKGQLPEKAWLIPVIDFTNNNGLVRDRNNVLRATNACGSFAIGPAEVREFKLEAGVRLRSNVDTTKTLLKVNELTQASAGNVAALRMKHETDKNIQSLF